MDERIAIASATQGLFVLKTPQDFAKCLVAKGGIEPPTQGFSELKRQYARLRHGMPSFAGTST